MTSRQRTIVLGLGNPILGDDGVGLRVAQNLRRRLADRGDIETGEACCGGLRLMERLIGFDRAIVIDAMCSQAKAGTVRVLPVEALPARHCACAHDADLLTALKLGRAAGARVPSAEDVRLVGIEIEPGAGLAFSEQCSPAVEAAVAQAQEAVLRLLDSWR